MFSRKYKKQNKLIKFILKFFNLYAYEKETLNMVNPDYKNVGKNLIKFNDTSFNLSKGYTRLSRKIKKLDIFYRYSPNNNLWNSSKSWKRIIPNIDKKTLISVSLISLKESILFFLKENQMDISLNLVSDNSDEKFDKDIEKFLYSEKFKINKFKSKIKGNRGSYLECCDLSMRSDDLIFFVEDDYLFEKRCIDEMIFSYSRLSTILKKDIIMCPSDYPFYYDSLYSTSLYFGKSLRWRNVEETLLTILFSKEIFVNNLDNFRLVGEKINEPFEKPLHDLYKRLICLAPVSSLSYHIGRDNPSINEDYLSLWNINLEIYNKYKSSSYHSQKQ